MTQPRTPDDSQGIDALGADPDFVTTDPDPEPDTATPGEGQRADAAESDSADPADAS